MAQMTKAQIETFFECLSAADPAPTTELNYANHYTLLVAVVLSAQATDVGVNKATEKLFKIADTPQKMLALGEAGLTEHIRTIGLYRNKAKNVIALSAQRAKAIASGSIDRAVTLKGIGATKGAREAIEAAGGKIEE